MENNKNNQREDIARLLRESVVPRTRPPQTISIEKFVVVVPGASAVEFLTALREALKDPH